VLWAEPRTPIEERTSRAYIMGETWYDRNPNLICPDWQVWVCSNQEMMEQAHVEGRLQWSDVSDTECA
jgi:hypothetical protein